MTQPILSKYWNEAEGQGRGYERPSTGERAPGVTTIIGLVNKDLAQWGSDMAVRWMTENWHAWNPGGKSDERAFNHARYRWKDYRDLRGAVGDHVHNYIEDTILGAGPFADDLEPEEQRIVAQWEEFAFFTGVKFHSTEATVWGDGYAGTLDAYGWMPSERLGRTALGVIDWKTSARAWPDSFMQLAALKNAKFQFRQVDEGTPGASESKARNSSTWWVEEPLPEGVETAWIVHLTEDSWAVHELSEEQLHLRRFMGYRDCWWAEKALKDTGIDLKKSLGSQGR